MAIQLYKQQTGPAVLGGLPPEPVQRPIDTQNTGDQLAIKSALKTGEQVGETMLKEEEQRQATDLVNASNDYSAATLEYENKYKLEHEGKDARNTVPDYEAWHKEMAPKFGKRLADNPRMDGLKAKSFGQIACGSSSRGTQHAYQQEQVYRKNEGDKLTTLYLQKAALNYDKPEVLNALTAGMKTNVQALFPDLDLTPKFAEIERKMATSVIQSGIHERDIDYVELLLYGDPDDPKDNGYQEIFGEMLPAVKGRVKALRVDVDAKKYTDEIALMPDLISKQEKYDALDELAKGSRYEEDTIKAGRQYIHRDHSYDKELAATRKKETNEHFIGRINGAKTAEESFQIIQDIIRTPMEEAQRATLLAKARKGVPYADRDNPKKYAEFQAEASNLSADEAYNKYKPDLTKKTMDSIVKIKEKAGSEVVEDFLKLFTNKVKVEYKARPALERDTNIILMNNAMNKFVRGHLDRHQENPSEEELEAYALKLFTRQVYDYGYFDWQDRSIEAGLFKTLEAEDVDVDPEDYEDIPIGYRNKIEADYRKQYGKEATPAEVANFYKQLLIDRTR